MKKDKNLKRRIREHKLIEKFVRKKKKNKYRYVTEGGFDAYSYQLI